MSKPKSEAQIQTEILKSLKARGVFCFRVNNMGVYDPKINGGYGGYRCNPYSMRGVPDIIAVEGDTGRMVGLEVKTAKGKQSADQVLFERRCKQKSARYHVVRSVADVEVLEF